MIFSSSLAARRPNTETCLAADLDGRVALYVQAALDKGALVGAWFIALGAETEHEKKKRSGRKKLTIVMGGSV